MRTLTSLALAASLAMVLGVAGQASALNSVGLVFLGGATGDPNCSVNPAPCVHTNSSDIIRFAIVITVDANGLGAFGLDLRWDADGEDELDFASATQRASLLFKTPNPSPPPDTLALASYTVSSANFASTESTAGNAGYLMGFDAFSASITGPFIANVSFRIGTVAFHVNGNVNNNAGADIEMGFFRTDGAAMSDSASNFITPNFGSFNVDSVPEPGTSLLMGMGVLGLILAGRANRKS